jgi:hypothetical protein
VQLYRYFVSQPSEFCRHKPLCCFSTSVCCCCLFRYRLSSETFGYTLVAFLAQFFTLTLPTPGLAELDFSLAGDPVPDAVPVPESLGSLVTSTTEWNLYSECLISSSGMSSGISSTKTVKVFCGRQGIGTWKHGSNNHASLYALNGPGCRHFKLHG